MKAKNIAAIGALNMAFAIAMGAFAAHRLKEVLDPYLLDVFGKAVKYHLIHSLALTVIPILVSDKIKKSNWIWYLQMAGILLFSGSLYLLSTRFELGLDSWKWLGAITPFGGLCFIASWLGLAFLLIKNKD